MKLFNKRNILWFFLFIMVCVVLLFIFNDWQDREALNGDVTLDEMQEALRKGDAIRIADYAEVFEWPIIKHNSQQKKFLDENVNYLEKISNALDDWETLTFAEKTKTTDTIKNFLIKYNENNVMALSDKDIDKHLARYKMFFYFLGESRRKEN